jgi:hypothetical protein
MPPEKDIRRGFRVSMLALLAGFALALVGPTEHTMGDITGSTTAGQGLANQAPVVQGLFLLGVEAVFVSFVFYLGYLVIWRDSTGNKRAP